MIASIEIVATAEEKLYAEGLADGCRSMMTASKIKHQSYREGFKRGLQYFKSGLPEVTESPLEVGWGDELLNPDF